MQSQDEVHFRILDRLTSSNQFESNSALFCISQVAAISESFSASVLRIAPSLLSTEQPSSSAFKIGFVSVLGEMKHSSLCGLSRQHIKSFLKSHPQEDFMIASLKALTRISDMQSEDQVNLLWEYLLSDPRPRVQLTCIRGLFAMATRAPHHGDHRPALLLSVLASTKAPWMQGGLLAVLAMISRRWRAVERLEALDTTIIATLLKTSNDARVLLWAMRALTSMAVVLASAADQLKRHIMAELKRTDISPHARRSPLLSACVVLCSEIVARHSPDCAAQILKALADAATASKGGGDAILHCLSIAASRASLPIAVSALNDDMLSGLAFEHVASPFGFASVAVTFVRLFRLFDNGVVASDLGKLGVLLRQVEPLVSQSTDWRWWWYCIAREAAVHGLHVASSSMFALLAGFPDSDSCRSWLLYLAELCQAERLAQSRLVLEASTAARRALMSIVSSTSLTVQQQQQQSSVGSVQTVARSNMFAAQKRYVKWRLGLFEAGVNRSDLWLGLGRDAEAMAVALPGMSEEYCAFMQDCASCCFAVAGSAVFPNEFFRRKFQLISRLRSSLSLVPPPTPRQIQEALYAASSLIPKDLLRSSRAFEVELAVAKLKGIPTDMMELNIYNSNETGHVVIVDGVVQGSVRRSFREVVLTMTVIWTSEKPSVAARLLCCEKKVGNVLSEQKFSAHIYNGSFSVPTMLTFSGQPKNQHLIVIRVALVEAETGRLFEDIALECVAYQQLIQ